MKNKKYIVYLVVSILVLTIGVSYAYFKARVSGEGKSISLRSKGIYMLYSGDATLASVSISPGWSVTKEFTVENQGSNNEVYNIYIEGLVNTFVTSGYLQYKITSSNGYNMTEYKDIPKSNTSDGLFESTQAIEDKFSASTSVGGNGKLKYPIALMTVDEIAFDGGKMGTSNSSVWYYTNSNNGSIVGAKAWWLLTSYNWTSSYSFVCGVRGYQQGIMGSIFNGDVDSTYMVRPVLSLSSCVKVTGTGTPTDPYVVNENSCS